MEGKIMSAQSFRRVFSGAPWEGEIGCCRAVRAGDHIFVTGTAPVDENGRTYAPGDGYAQTRRWEEYGRAHREFFAGHPPATSMIEIKSLIDPDMLIEIEADAVCTT